MGELGASAVQSFGAGRSSRCTGIRRRAKRGAAGAGPRGGSPPPRRPAASEPISWSRRLKAQGPHLGGNLAEDRSPIVRRALPKQAHRGVPARLFALETPAPIRRVFQRDPDGTPEGAGQV